MDVEIVIPIAGMATGLLMIAAPLYFFYRMRLIAHQTLRIAMDKGIDTPALIDALNSMASRPVLDLRRAIWLFALGAAVGVFGRVYVPDVAMVAGAAVFPLAIGLGYLVMWWFGRAVDRDRPAGGPAAVSS